MHCAGPRSTTGTCRHANEPFRRSILMRVLTNKAPHNCCSLSLCWTLISAAAPAPHKVELRRASHRNHCASWATLSDTVLVSLRRIPLPTTSASMTSGLPQSVADDLRLLQHHYDQLPDVSNARICKGSLHKLMTGREPTDAAAREMRASIWPEAQLAAAGQVVTSAAGAKDLLPQRTSRKAARSMSLEKNSSFSFSHFHSLDAQPVSMLSSGDSSGGRTVFTSAPIPATAAAGGGGGAAAAVADEDASMLPTPPPKPPRRRRTTTEPDCSILAAVPGPCDTGLEVPTCMCRDANISNGAAVVAAAKVADVEPISAGDSLPIPQKRRRYTAATAVQTAGPGQGADVTTSGVHAQMVTEQRSCRRISSSAVAQHTLAPSSVAKVTAAAAEAVRCGTRKRTRQENPVTTSRLKSVAAVEVESAADVTVAAAGPQVDCVANAQTCDPEVPAAPASGGPRAKSSRGRTAPGIGSHTARDRRQSKQGAAAAADEYVVHVAAAQDACVDPTESAAELVADAAAKVAQQPVKPVRRTKKVIAAEVLEAASQGQFSELTDLSNVYSHVGLFTSRSMKEAWQQLVQQRRLQDSVSVLNTVDAAHQCPTKPQQQQQQQQEEEEGSTVVRVSSIGRSSSLSLCRSSGLGSFRQQVWIHSHSQAELEAEAGVTQESLPLLSSSQAESTDHPDAAAAQTDPFLGVGEAAFGHQLQAPPAAAVDGTQAQPAKHGLQQSLNPALQQPLNPALQQGQLKVLPNLGYACLCMTMRKYDIFNSRNMVKKTRDAADGLQKASQLALQNARDLVPLIHWNEAHGIRLFRLSSNIFPWMTSYSFEDLPDWPGIQKALRAAGELAKHYGHRLTFHPSEYVKIAGERPEWVDQSVSELEVHSRIFDEMGFLPATPYNKINFHVGGTYGDKEAALERFSQVVNTRLSANCKARLTVENDDRASLYSIMDLMKVHKATGIPIVFDFHHWKFCTGDQTQEEAFKTALTTWPAGVRPLVHWSESPEDPKKMLKAHSEYVDGPIHLYGLEGAVDVMIESKGKELALLEYRQYIIEGWPIGPRQARAAKYAGAAATAAAADNDSEGDEGVALGSSSDDG